MIEIDAYELIFVHTHWLINHDDDDDDVDDNDDDVDNEWQSVVWVAIIFSSWFNSILARFSTISTKNVNLKINHE